MRQLTGKKNYKARSCNRWGTFNSRCWQTQSCTKFLYFKARYTILIIYVKKDSERTRVNVMKAIMLFMEFVSLLEMTQLQYLLLLDLEISWGCKYLEDRKLCKLKHDGGTKVQWNSNIITRFWSEIRRKITVMRTAMFWKYSIVVTECGSILSGIKMKNLINAGMSWKI